MQASFRLWNGKTRLVLVSKNGNPNAQLELSSTTNTVANVVKKLLLQTAKFRIYLAGERWRNHVKRMGATMSNSNNARVMLTDFGPSLDLRATEVGNYSVGNHAVTRALFVVCNWRRVRFWNNEAQVEDESMLDDCDKWVFFGDTVSKGKKMIMSSMNPVLSMSPNSTMKSGFMKISLASKTTRLAPTTAQLNANAGRISFKLLNLAKLEGEANISSTSLLPSMPLKALGTQLE